eukprot:SAG31_NODE_1324_length_8789_cov_2.736249_5_plen_66_part_00
MRYAEFSQWWDAQPYGLRIKLFRNRNSSDTRTGAIDNPIVDPDNLSTQEQANNEFMDMVTAGQKE